MAALVVPDDAVAAHYDERPMASDEPKAAGRQTVTAYNAGTPELDATGERLIAEAYAGSLVLAVRGNS